jgi:perosamine synthetase
LYNDQFRNFPYFNIPLEKSEFAENIYWVYGILLNEKSKMNAEELMKLLNKKNIGTRPFFYPMHLQPVFKKMGLFENEKYPVSEKLSEFGFYIPSGLALTEEQIVTSAEALKSLF